MTLLLLVGCAALIHGGVGATSSMEAPLQNNVSLQLDAGFSPVESGDLADNLSAGFGLSARSRVDDVGQLNDFGVHLFSVYGEEAFRGFLRTTLFSVGEPRVRRLARRHAPLGVGGGHAGDRGELG
jgi:hypothetical protein